MEECARLVPTAGYPVVCGEVRSPDARRTVLIYGHYDVQPSAPWNVPSAGSP